MIKKYSDVFETPIKLPLDRFRNHKVKLTVETKTASHVMSEGGKRCY